MKYLIFLIISFISFGQTHYDLSSVLATYAFLGDLQYQNAAEINQYGKLQFQYAKDNNADFYSSVGDNTENDSTILLKLRDSLHTWGINDNQFIPAIGNHDTYAAQNKFAYKTLLDSLGVYYEIVAGTPQNYIHTLTELSYNIVVITLDHLKGNALTDPYVNNPDTIWICNKLDSLYTAGKSVIIVTHFPMWNPSGSHPGEGYTTTLMDDYRLALSRKPNLLSVINGHRHVYCSSIEENNLAFIQIDSYVKNASHPLNNLYADVIDTDNDGDCDFVRFTLKNHAGSTTTIDGSTSLGVITIHNFPEFEENWRSIIVPFRRTIFQ